MSGLLITAVEAAAMLQPFLSDVNAFNMLVDWRRKSPRYHLRVLRPPFFLKGKGRSAPIRYPKSEIDRVIREILTLRVLKAGL